MEQKNKVIVKIENLEVSFHNKVKKTKNIVIRNTGFELREKEVLAIIGESGSGKSVITSTLVGLLPKTASIAAGRVIVDGIDVTKFTESDWEESELRGRIISQVFQNPMTALNPTMKIGTQLIEGSIINFRAASKKEAKQDAISLMQRIGINNAPQVMKLYPHQLSGGMRQRVCIAAALLCQPKIIIFDEPTTALDPTIQAEILQLIQEIKNIFNLAIIFISHDLGVVGSISDRIAIMYAGKIIEYGTAKEVLYNSKHPYTWGLIQAMPDANLGEVLYSIPGQVPSNFNDIVGDAFAERNQFALDVDFIEHPPFFKISETHFVASWLYDDRAQKVVPPKIITKRYQLFEATQKPEIKELDDGR